MAELLLLVAAPPSVGLALAAGYAPGFLPLALLAYYTYPLLLMAGGRLLRGEWRERLPENLLLPPALVSLLVLAASFGAERALRRTIL